MKPPFEYTPPGARTARNEARASRNTRADAAKKARRDERRNAENKLPTLEKKLRDTLALIDDEIRKGTPAKQLRLLRVLVLDMKQRRYLMLEKVVEDVSKGQKTEVVAVLSVEGNEEEEPSATDGGNPTASASAEVMPKRGTDQW